MNTPSTKAKATRPEIVKRVTKRNYMQIRLAFLAGNFSEYEFEIVQYENPISALLKTVTEEALFEIFRDAYSGAYTFTCLDTGKFEGAVEDEPAVDLTTLTKAQLGEMLGLTAPQIKRASKDELIAAVQAL